MKKIILIPLCLLVFIIGALIVVPSFVDWNVYKSEIKAQIIKESGYQIDIQGDLSGTILPYPHITVNDVTLNSHDVEGPYDFDINVQEASVSVALIPLLSGNVVIRNISLIKPQVTLTETSSNTKSINPAQSSASPNLATANNLPIKIERFYLEKAEIHYTPLSGNAIQASFPSLTLKAENILGPYEIDGAVNYNEMTINFDGSIGAYDTQTPMTIDMNLSNDLYKLSYAGLVDLGKSIPEFQGEVKAALSSVQALSSNQLPIHDLPIEITGIIAGSTSSVTLSNGKIALNDAAGVLTLKASDLDKNTKKIQSSISFENPLNLDIILNLGKSGLASYSDSGTTSNKNNEISYTFLPDTLELPHNLNVTFDLTVPSVIYNNQSVDNVAVAMALKDGLAKTTIKAEKIPGGGAINISSNLTSQSSSRNKVSATTILSKPALDISGNLTINSLPTIASHWLGLIEDAVFESPYVPSALDTKFNITVQGDQLRLKAPTLNADPYKIKDIQLTYKNAASSQINLSAKNFEGATISASGTMDATHGVKISASHPHTIDFIRVFQPDFQSIPLFEKPFSLNGTVFQDKDMITLDGMTAKISNIDATGKIAANTSGPIPFVSANLQFGTLDTQALLTGKQPSSPASASGNTSKTTSNGQSPWTRDAIDTSFMRSINLDLNATANSLIHGTWRIVKPTIDVDLSDGVLNVNTISGGLYGGSMTMNGRVDTKAANKPMTISATIDAKNINLGQAVKSALSQNKDRVIGTGDMNLSLTTSGLSSSALVYALNGDGQINTSNLVLLGIDLAKITEAIDDESLSDVAAVIKGAFRNGQTEFAAIDQPIIIREGSLDVDQFTLKSETANLIADGQINFAQWAMDLKNAIVFTGEYSDLPSIKMTLSGPLNAPQQNIASDVLKSFIKNKYGGKIRNLIQDKLGEDNNAGKLINNILGQNNISSIQNQPDNHTDDSLPEKTQKQDEPSLGNGRLIRGLIDQFEQ